MGYVVESKTTSCVWLHYLRHLIISNKTGISQLKIM